MELVKWKDVEDVKIAKFPYKGQPYDVKGISVRWLSKFGDDGTGYPEYGLRLFTAQPGGEIPIHNHFYIQTMYILSGRFECYQFDQQTDQKTKSCLAGAGDTVVVPSRSLTACATSATPRPRPSCAASATSTKRKPCRGADHATRRTPEGS